MIGRWAQELTEYQFTVTHIPDRMMAGADDIARFFGPLLAKHLEIFSMLGERYQLQYPKACVLEISKI